MIHSGEAFGFRSGAHVMRIDYDPELPLAMSLDYQRGGKSVCLWLQFLPNGAMRVIGSIQMEARSAMEFGQAMCDRHLQLEYGDVAWAAGDPHDKDFRYMMRRHFGLPTTFKRFLVNVIGGSGAEELARGVALREIIAQGKLAIDPRCEWAIEHFSRVANPIINALAVYQARAPRDAPRLFSPTGLGTRRKARC